MLAFIFNVLSLYIKQLRIPVKESKYDGQCYTCVKADQSILFVKTKCSVREKRPT